MGFFWLTESNVLITGVTQWLIRFDEFLSQAGILRGCRRLGLALAMARSCEAGRGWADSMSMPAARISARASTKFSSKCINSLRKLATRLSRVSWNSASSPLLSVRRYAAMRDSRWSAVRGLCIVSPRPTAAPESLVESCLKVTSFDTSNVRKNQPYGRVRAAGSSRSLSFPKRQNASGKRAWMHQGWASHALKSFVRIAVFGAVSFAVFTMVLSLV